MAARQVPLALSMLALVSLALACTKKEQAPGLGRRVFPGGR